MLSGYSAASSPVVLTRNCIADLSEARFTHLVLILSVSAEYLLCNENLKKMCWSSLDLS